MVDLFKRVFKSKQRSESNKGNVNITSILLYADVDMNLIDGSSIWLNSLTQVLAMEESFNITLFLKARVKNDRLISELSRLRNVTIINTFDYFRDYKFENNNRLTSDDASILLVKLEKTFSYDCIIIRGFDIAEKAILSLDYPEKIIPYFTSWPGLHSKSTTLELMRLKTITSRVKYIFLQTPEMKNQLLELIACHKEKIVLLPPMIPDFHETSPTFENASNTLIYAGKFSNEYLIVESLEIFRNLNLLNERKYCLNIAGDKFHTDLKVPQSDLIRLMEEIPGVKWHKGLDRESVAKLIQVSDLGLCWRSKVIDNERSLEMSTKILEYGRLGKPVILRRIPIHLRMLGHDYPFFADTEQEFLQKIQLSLINKELYRKAALTIYKLSEPYTFSNTILNIKKVIQSISDNNLKW